VYIFYKILPIMNNIGPYFLSHVVLRFSPVNSLRLRLRDQRSKWMQDGCKLYVNLYVAPNGSCFMVVCWTVFKNKPSFGGRPNTKWGDHGTPRSHSRWFMIYFSCVRIMHEKKFIEIACGWGPDHMWLHTTLEGLWLHYNSFGSVLGRPLDTSFRLSQFHGHGSWLVCEVAPRLNLSPLARG
jgi:hypothetical protein